MVNRWFSETLLHHLIFCVNRGLKFDCTLVFPIVQCLLNNVMYEIRVHSEIVSSVLQ